MKLQLIHLDPEDDQVSVRDKLSWARASRAVLVWPRRGRVLTRRLDLVLLQRQAARQRVELGLVTYDPAVLHLAGLLGIPTFESPDHLPEVLWQARRVPGPLARPSRRPRDELQSLAERIPAQTPTQLSLPRRARLVIASLAALCALAVGASILPSAVITLAPRSEVFTVPLEFVLDPSLKPPAASSRLPAVTIRARLRAEGRGEVSGSTSVPSAAATGTAVLTNLTAEPIVVPAGTGLRASESGVRFFTLEAAELAAGVGESAEVSIQADAAGPQGNLPGGAIDAVEGSIGFQIRATNPEPTSGGGEAVMPAVSEIDRTRLRTELMDGLLDRALPEMAASLAPGLTLAPESLQVSQVLQERYDFEVGQPTTSLGLTLEVEFVALAVPSDEVEAAAARLLAEELPKRKQAVPGSLLLRRDPRRDGRLPSGEYTLAYLAEQQVAELVDVRQVRREVAGSWAASAPARLAERFELDRLPSIERRPAWLPVLPWLTIRLHVRWIWDPA